MTGPMKRSTCAEMRAPIVACEATSSTGEDVGAPCAFVATYVALTYATDGPASNETAPWKPRMRRLEKSANDQAASANVLRGESMKPVDKRKPWWPKYIRAS